MDSSEPLRLHTLPVDIIIDIFKALPSFALVPSLVLAHRAFNDVWVANFNEIAPFIARKNFQPWSDALNLMLEQKNLDYDVIALPGPYMRLSKDDIAQLQNNARYVNYLQRTHNEWKEGWWKCPLTESEVLRYHRATYRLWKFMLTMYLPKCEDMCDGYTIMDLIDMQTAARKFDVYYDFEVTGLPDFEKAPTGTAINSLSGMLRRRVAAFCECDESIELDDVYECNKKYADLVMLDPEETKKDKEWVKSVFGKLEHCEKKLKEKQQGAAAAKTAA